MLWEGRYICWERRSRISAKWCRGRKSQFTPLPRRRKRHDTVPAENWSNLSLGKSVALLLPLSSARQSTQLRFFQHEGQPQACSYHGCSGGHLCAGACVAKAGVSAVLETYDAHSVVVYHCPRPAPIPHGRLLHSLCCKCVAACAARPQPFWLTRPLARQYANDGAEHHSLPEDVPNLPGRWCLPSSRPAEVYS